MFYPTVQTHYKLQDRDRNVRIIEVKINRTFFWFKVNKNSPRNNIIIFMCGYFF